MKTQPNISAEQRERLLREDQYLRPQLASEQAAVRDEWRAYFRNLTEVVSQRAEGIDACIQNHVPMTRSEVVDLALKKLLTEA